MTIEWNHTVLKQVIENRTVSNKNVKLRMVQVKCKMYELVARSMVLPRYNEATCYSLSKLTTERTKRGYERPFLFTMKFK